MAAKQSIKEISYWPGCLRLLKQTDQWQTALQLEVKLNDINLLNGCTPYGFTPRNLDEWKYLLRLYQQQSASQPQSHHRQAPVSSSHTDLPLPPDPPPPTPATSLPSSSAPMEVCLFPSSPESTAVVGRDADLTDVQNTDASSSPECSRSDGEAGEQSPLESAGAKNTLTEGDTDDHNTLSWLSLGLLAAHHIGAAKAVYLLQECAVEERRGEETAGGAEGGAVLSADFFKACLALSATTNQQKLVIHNMLEKVDSYLWAKKPVHLTPQVHYAATQEKLAVGNSNTDDHNYHNLFARLSSAPVEDKQLAEDPDCHWGVQVNIFRVCEACGIELNETVSHLEPGLYTFKCGHVFHKFCAPEKQCPLC